MSPRPLALAGAVAWLVLVVPAVGAPARKVDDTKAKTEKAANEDKEPTAWTARPILLVANEVIKRRLFDASSDEARSISVKGGLVGLGAYNPRGGADFGMKAPPRHLFPGAGAGNSLNVDPMTGHSYFTNMP